MDVSTVHAAVLLILTVWFVPSWSYLVLLFWLMGVHIEPAKIDAQDARIAAGDDGQPLPKGVKIPRRYDDRAERMANNPGPYFAEAYERAERWVRGETDG